MKTVNRIGLWGVALLAGAGAALAAGEAAERGPNGGHLVDAGKYHLELVVKGRELRLHVSDLQDRKVAVAGGSARATVIASGGKGTVDLVPEGGNVLKGTGTFAPTKTMKVDLLLTLPGVPAPVAAKFQPLATTGEGHDHKGHKH